ncbi:MAG TPA: hypothetical protein VFY13_04855 [Luteolibacter sp.]|nr:hypothetical protein [Luteolibacter sp.]
MNEPAKSKGCPAVIIFIVLGVLALLAIPVLAFLMFFMKRTTISDEHRAHEMMEHAIISRGSGQDAADESNEIHFKEGAMPRGIAEIGDDLSREAFVGFTLDSNATTLAKEAFIKNANGRTVRWLVRVGDITADPNGGLSGQFELPYKIHSENGWTGSSVSLHAAFPDSEKAALTQLNRNDWVTIEGRLEMKGSYLPSLLEAKVVGGR